MCLLRNVTLGYRVCVTKVQCKALMKELNMLASKKFLEAGDFLQELSAQEIDAKAPETGGGCCLHRLLGMQQELVPALPATPPPSPQRLLTNSQ